MTGKQIAENLRQNRDRWARYRYYKDGKYCVLGLKLHEQGVAVEGWGPEVQDRTLGHVVYKLGIADSVGSGGLNYREVNALVELQQANDESDNVDNVIKFAEQNAEREFPIEKLAAAIKQVEATPSMSK